MKPRPLAAAAHPDPQAIATLAEWIAAAERPLIITADAAGATPCRRLAQLAERCAIPVVTHSPRTVCLPSSHPMHFGFEPGALLADADLVIVLESDVPWIPHRAASARAGCRVAHVGEDPFFVRYPMRSFPSDLAVRPASQRARRARRARSSSALQMAEARIAARRARLTERMRNAPRAARQGCAPPANDISPEYLSRARSAKRSATTPSSSTNIRCAPIIARARSPARSIALGPAGGLGWGFGAALGAKLAAPDKFVVATLGDGAYMFANPTVGHWVSARAQAADPHHRLQQQPLRRGAARHACRCSRTASPARTTAASSPISIPRRLTTRWRSAQGAHAERVEKAAELPDALARARDAVRQRASGRRCSTSSRLTEVNERTRHHGESSCVSTPTPISSRRSFSTRWSRAAIADIGKRMREVPCHPRSRRRRKKVVDKFKDYAQILSYPMPPLEVLAKGRAGRGILPS